MAVSMYVFSDSGHVLDKALFALSFDSSLQTERLYSLLQVNQNICTQIQEI